jgi:hypothetical protein
MGNFHSSSNDVCAPAVLVFAPPSAREAGKGEAGSRDAGGVYVALLGLMRRKRDAKSHIEGERASLLQQKEDAARAKRASMA